MTNECVLKQWQEDPVDFIVSDSVGIEKGAILQLTDPRTASAGVSGSEFFAGIARREKIANDGRTRLALFRKGIFDMTCNPSVGIQKGVAVSMSGSNFIKTATVVEQQSGGIVIGNALETATAGEVIEVAVNA